MEDDKNIMDQEIQIINQKEESSIFTFDGFIDRSKIRKQDLSLEEKHNFETTLLKRFSNLVVRNNIIKYGFMCGEEAIPTEQTNGRVIIPVIHQEQIRKRLEKIKPEERRKIGFIHISTIQILIKSTFLEGIESPITLEIRDDRIINKNEALIAKGKGNLREGKIKFDINLQLGICLRDKSLSRSIVINYKLEREPLMKEGDHPFTITYKINYALTNSHHSITFRQDEKIKIDKLFTPLLALEPNQNLFRRNFVNRTRLIENSIEEGSLLRTSSVRIQPPIEITRRNSVSEESSIIQLTRKIDQLSNRI